MEPEKTSFWTEIKKFEDTLATDPASYCFAPLAELYRRIGLVDDAITVAEKGTALHPDYVGGHLALGRAYYEHGRIQDARTTLERVVRFTPENILAQRLLSQIYVETGESALAVQALEHLVAANPADTESRMMLESLQRSTHGASRPDISDVDEEFDSAVLQYDVLDEGQEVEDIEELELIEILDDDLSDQDFLTVAETCVPEEAEQDDEPPSPLPVFRTATVAELFASQGHTDEAASIYRELAAERPEIQAYANRLNELASSQSQQEPSDYHVQVEPEITSDAIEPLCSASSDTFIAEPMHESSAMIDVQADTSSEIEMLELWLANIRRVRSCHSEKA